MRSDCDPDKPRRRWGAEDHLVSAFCILNSEFFSQTGLPFANFSFVQNWSGEVKMRLFQKSQRVSAVAIAALLLSPVSLIAESRRLSETDMRRMAEELSAILGAGSVRVERGDARPAPSRRTSQTERASSPSSFDSRAVLDAMNRYRREAGRPPLRLSGTLSLVAGDRVEHMMTNGYFDHVSPDGVQPFVWLPRRGYRYSTAGENLASGYRSADALVQGWMSSPAHRANILGNYEEVGLAAAPEAPVRRMSGPLVVAMYASPMVGGSGVRGQ